jgi:hypothetical protein
MKKIENSKGFGAETKGRPIKFKRESLLKVLNQELSADPTFRV